MSDKGNATKKIGPQALSCKGADVMSILDNRAATYIKLTQYDRALNDSRQMIRRDTKDGRVACSLCDRQLHLL